MRLRVILIIILSSSLTDIATSASSPPLFNHSDELPEISLPEDVPAEAAYLPPAKPSVEEPGQAAQQLHRQGSHAASATDAAEALGIDPTTLLPPNGRKSR